MGGVAGAAGPRALSTPRWLIGGGATLSVALDAPTLWLLDLNDAGTRHRAEGIAPLAGEAEGFARHADAGERLLRRRLSRLLLAAATGGRADAVAIGRDANGAPTVREPTGWHLGVAARWPRCLIGIAPVPIGVDIEAVDAPLPPDLLTAAERALATGTADEGARRWAAKEAHAKWSRQPRQLDPADIETARLPIVASRFGTTRCWLRTEHNCIAAVCIA